MMKRVMRSLWWMAIAALCLAPLAVAQNVDLTSVQGSSYDGVYVSPYYATVNGVATTVVCDDFADESKLPSSWTAAITPFSSLNAGVGGLAGTAWGNVSGTTFSMYEEAAWLTLQVLAQTPGSQGQIDYSYALWALFDPAGVAAFLDHGGSPSSTDIALCNEIFGGGNCTTSNVVAGGLLSSAANQTYYAGEFSNMEVIAAIDAGGSVCTPGSTGLTACPAQEFIAVVSEGGATLAYLFLAGLCCFGAMFLRSRRQVATMEAA
jgi:hypothetical protein